MLKFLQPHSTLLISSSLDLASINIFSSLLTRPYWNQIEHSNVYIANKKDGGKLYLWMQDEPLLALDYADSLFNTHMNYNEDFSDIVFLSKHIAASGKPSLTVHPIGIPWQTENSKSGGIPGKCSPPNKRIASIYRQLLTSSKEFQSITTDTIDENKLSFDITMEATHHGPYCTTPACFVEIGSSENEWSIPEFGRIWADVIEAHFELSSDVVSSTISSTISSTSTMQSVVVVCIGGGHYVPKANDLARLGEGLYIGHAITTYAIGKQFSPGNEDFIDGKWKLIIEEAILSTLISYKVKYMHVHSICAYK